MMKEDENQQNVMDADDPWAAVQAVGGSVSALDLALTNQPLGKQAEILKVSHLRGLDKNDPVLDLFAVSEVAFDSAVAASAAASTIKDHLSGLPDTIQKAVLFGAGDIKGEVKQAFDSNVETLKTNIAGGIKGGAKISIDALNLVNEKFTKAISEFDSKLDNAIIQHKDQVLAEWAQSGSEELNRRIRAEVKRKQNFSLGFMLFLNWMFLIIGAIGMFLLIHLK